MRVGVYANVRTTAHRFYIPIGLDIQRKVYMCSLMHTYTQTYIHTHRSRHKTKGLYVFTYAYIYIDIHTYLGSHNNSRWAVFDEIVCCLEVSLPYHTHAYISMH